MPAIVQDNEDVDIGVAGDRGKARDRPGGGVEDREPRSQTADDPLSSLVRDPAVVTGQVDRLEELLEGRLHQIRHNQKIGMTGDTSTMPRSTGGTRGVRPKAGR